MENKDTCNNASIGSNCLDQSQKATKVFFDKNIRIPTLETVIQSHSFGYSPLNPFPNDKF